MCSINGNTPFATSTGMLQGSVHFTGSLRCDVAGITEITVAALQADLNGAHHSQKMAGPLTSGSLTSPGLVMLGVNTDPTGCVSIAFDPWRGAIHPRLTTTAGVYDWGWYANAPVNLNC